MCLLTLFCAISVVASDFFCPNLQTISNKLQLSESMAGVTVLALGNGSPDLFSTFSALDTGAGSLAIGELIGAAFFIVAIVSGCMAIIKPFQSQKITFKRDATFLSGAIMIITWIVYHQRIYWYHSLILIGYYIMYVSVVVLGAYTTASTQMKDESTFVNESTHLLIQGECKPSKISIPTKGFQSIHSNMSEFSSQQNLGHIIRPLSPNSSRRSIYFDAMLPRSTSTAASISNYRRPMTPKVGMRTSVFGAIEFQDQINHIRRTSSNHLLPTSSSHPRQLSIPAWPTSPSSHSLLNPNPPEGRPRASTIHDRPILLSPNLPQLQLENQDYFTYISTQLQPPPKDEYSLTVPEIRLAPSDEETPYRSSLAPPSLFSEHDAGFVSARQSFELSPSIYYSFHQRPEEEVEVGLAQVFFPTLTHWSGKGGWARLSAVAAVPFVLVFTLTLPVAELDEIKVDEVPIEEDALLYLPDLMQSKNHLSVPGSVNELSEVKNSVETKQGWSKKLVIIQCFTTPFFVLSLFAVNGLINYLFVPMSLVLGVPMAWFVHKTTKPEEPPSWFWALSFGGFFVALNWIFLLANEVVGLLQAIGEICSISEAIMGLTIFALGNSVGDFVANTAIAKMGFPTMAISACYAGPLLNMVLGVGVSSFYQTWKSGTYYPLEIAPTIIISAFGLITVLLSTLVVVNINGFKVTKNLGWWMITVYIICCITNLSIEFSFIF